LLKIKNMTDRLKKLRELASKIHKVNAENLDFNKYKDDISLLIEELSISQIELELQNEELLFAQQLLELEKMRFSDLFINAPVGYFKFDSKGSILDFNARALQTLAISSNLIKNTPFITFVEKEYHSAFYLHLHAIFTIELTQGILNTKQSQIEIAIINSKKEKRFLRLHSNLMFDPVLNEKYCRTIAEDITLEKQSRVEILQLSERIEASMRAGNLAWWEVELPSGNVYFNENKAKMLGFSPERFKHYSDFMKLVHPEDYENAMMAFKMHLTGEKEAYQCEYRIRNSDNVYLWFYDVGKIVHQQRENIRVTGIVTNITEQKYYEQSLKGANATKDRLISVLAHDLRSPFGAILGFSELLLLNHKNYTEDKNHSVISTIYKSTKNAYNLLENLLTWANSQTGKIAYRPSTLDLKMSVFENISLLKYILETKNIVVTNKIVDSIFVNADKNLLDIILRNILTNAIKFTPRDGRITLEIERKHGGFVEISIKDTGIGISAEILDNLFQIGKNITTLGTENENGTGLGLVLCKEFALKNGGDIYIKIQENKGTSVYLSIPISQEQNVLKNLGSHYDFSFVDKLLLEIGSNLSLFYLEASKTLFPKWEELKEVISIDLIIIANEKLLEISYLFNSNSLLELHKSIENSTSNFSLNDIYFYINFFENLKNTLLSMNLFAED